MEEDFVVIKDEFLGVVVFIVVDVVVFVVGVGILVDVAGFSLDVVYFSLVEENCLVVVFIVDAFVIIVVGKFEVAADDKVVTVVISLVS